MREPPPVVYNPRLPPEFFDVVIVDECHRSIYTLWRQVLEYFDCSLVGLTATPAKHTYAFFSRNVVSEYRHEHAVRDKVNVPFSVYEIRTAFIGYKPSLAEKQQFWRSVAFYNYVQENVGLGARRAPAPEMWTRSEPAFAELLREHAPQVLIVLGYRLWNYLPDLDGAWDEPIEGANQTQTWRYPLPNGGTCLAYGIRHPSSGFTGSRWQPHVLEAIHRA